MEKQKKFKDRHALHCVPRAIWLAVIGLLMLMLFACGCWQYKCCGLNSYQDFNSSTSWNRTKTLTISGSTQTVNLETPFACCATTGTFPNINFIDSANCAVHPNDTISNWKTVGLLTAVADSSHEFNDVSAQRIRFRNLVNNQYLDRGDII